MTLYDELHGDPLGKGYAAFLPDSPGTVADMLNALTETRVKPITTATAQKWAAAGPYAGIVDAANAIGHACRASCLVVQQTFSAGLDIHLDDPAVAGMFDAWLTAGVITQAQYDGLIALATQPASRMEVLGLPPATVQDVIGAL